MTYLFIYLLVPFFFFILTYLSNLRRQMAASFAIKWYLDFPLMLLGLVLIPIGLLFRKDNHMPRLFWLWDNDDHGVNGEGFFAKIVATWPKWMQHDFIRCFVWTAIRNPTFNFTTYLIGYRVKDTDVFVIADGSNLEVSRDGEPGWYFVSVGKAWEYQYIKPYKLFGRSFCVKMRYGWKIAGKEPGEQCSFVFAPIPLIIYTGK